MELKLKFCHKNTFPLTGFVIKGNQAKSWFKTLQNLGFKLNTVSIYPLPGIKANSIWGCLVLCNRPLTSAEVGKNELCQQVSSSFYIPEKTEVTPEISSKDNELLFKEKLHFFHPEIGMVQVEEEIDKQALLTMPKEKYRYIFSPADSYSIPITVKSFQVFSKSPEEALKEMEENTVKKREKLPDKPLSIAEKLKLNLYKKMFKKSPSSKKSGKEGGKQGNVKIPSGLAKIMASVMGKGKAGDLMESMKQDYENLEERNQKEVDKLLKMLQDDPEKALKYAIPLDEHDISRGIESGSYNMSKLWSSFSLGSSVGGGGGGSINLGDGFNRLQQQYHQTAEQLIGKKEFEKAAFVYLKLLKNERLAAETLEKGGIYDKAAAVYIKYCKDERSAALCYEKGKMYEKAIEYYEREQDYIKVGDLYSDLNNRPKAKMFYRKEVYRLVTTNHYIAAADVHKHKLNDLNKAQETLWEGWTKNIEPTRCLTQYFGHILDEEEKLSEINRTYKLAEKEQIMSFFKVLKKEFKHTSNLKPELKELGYEIIANQVIKHPEIANDLALFSGKDTKISNDISRFKSYKTQ